jgi:hypothetical protein
MEIYKASGDAIVDRETLALALGLSPNRVSELTKRGQLQAASKRPLRYSLEHNRSCYDNYKWALEVKAGIWFGCGGRDLNPRSGSCRIMSLTEGLCQSFDRNHCRGLGV